MRCKTLPRTRTSSRNCSSAMANGTIQYASHSVTGCDSNHRLLEYRQSPLQRLVPGVLAGRYLGNGERVSRQPIRVGAGAKTSILSSCGRLGAPTWGATRPSRTRGRPCTRASPVQRKHATPGSRLPGRHRRRRQIETACHSSPNFSWCFWRMLECTLSASSFTSAAIFTNDASSRRIL